MGCAGERVSEFPPQCVVRLRLGCAAPGGRDASQMLTDGSGARAQGGSPCFWGVYSSGCCGERCDPETAESGT